VFGKEMVSLNINITSIDPRCHFIFICSKSKNKKDEVIETKAGNKISCSELRPDDEASTRGG
jgi:hypothetical protein